MRCCGYFRLEYLNGVSEIPGVRDIRAGSNGHGKGSIFVQCGWAIVSHAKSANGFIYYRNLGGRGG